MFESIWTLNWFLHHHRKLPSHIRHWMNDILYRILQLHRQCFCKQSCSLDFMQPHITVQCSAGGWLHFANEMSCEVSSEREWFQMHRLDEISSDFWSQCHTKTDWRTHAVFVVFALSLNKVHKTNVTQKPKMHAYKFNIFSWIKHLRSGVALNFRKPFLPFESLYTMLMCIQMQEVSLIRFGFDAYLLCIKTWALRTSEWYKIEMNAGKRSARWGVKAKVSTYLQSTKSKVMQNATNTPNCANFTQ